MKYSLDQMREKAEKMNAYLSEKPGNDPHELIERIELLSILISQSGELLAQAKFLQDEIIHSEIMKALKEGYAEQLTPSALNKFVNSLAKEQNFMVNLFDRINSCGVHTLDGCRSILSYRKAEFSSLSYGGK